VSAGPIDTPIAIGGWQSGLLHKIGKGGKPSDQLRAIIANAVTILANDQRWTGSLAYDEFAESFVTLKVPPWREVDRQSDPTPGDWTDEDTTRTQAWLSDAYALDLGREATLSAVNLVAHRKRVHPVRDWLESLTWDGKQRLPTWLIEIMGADDTPYIRAIGTAWAISAVARVYRPGCKVDTVLVFEGPTGIFKSSVLRALVGDSWFVEMSLTDVNNKDAMQVLRRKWIAEFPEIDSLSRAEQGHVKAYFSRQVDTYRPSYARMTRDFPRQIAFAATTNQVQYLTDETGGSGRRNWPVRCVRGDVALATSMRDQFWAEARARYQSAEAWHMLDPELRDAEREEQEARYRPDPWEQSIASWLSRPSDVGVSKSSIGVTAADILEGALRIDVAKRTHSDAIRVGSVMRRLGWVPSQHPQRRDGARVRVYRPLEGSATNGSSHDDDDDLKHEPTVAHTNGVRADRLASEDDCAEPTEDLFPPRHRQG